MFTSNAGGPSRRKPNSGNSANSGTGNAPWSPSRRQYSIGLDDQDDDDDDASVGTSAQGAGETASNASGPRRRRQVNRSVPQMSYAYGAPSDRSDTGRASIGAGRNSLGAFTKGLHHLHPHDSTVPGPSPDAEEARARLDRNAQPAAQRYAALRAARAQGSSAAPAAGTGPFGSPIKSSGRAHGDSASQAGLMSPPRRSARLSVASASQEGGSARGGKGARGGIDLIDEDQAVESADEDGEAAEEVGRGTRNGAGAQLSSFFLRARQSLSPAPPVPSAPLGLTGNSSLLRGAQRPSHDPMSPGGADLRSPFGAGIGMTSIRSSEAGDSRSYDYAAEEQFAAELEAKERARAAAGSQETVQEESRGWLGSLSPWGKSKEKNAQGSANGTGESGPAPGSAGAALAARLGPRLASDDDESEYEHHGSGERRPRRRGRPSKDNAPYRPAEESESDSAGSDEGRKHSHRRKATNKYGGMEARAGKDDNKIWMGGKKRKGRKGRRKNGEVGDEGEEVGDTTLEGEGGGEYDGDTTTEYAQEEDKEEEEEDLGVARSDPSLFTRLARTAYLLVLRLLSALWAPIRALQGSNLRRLATWILGPLLILMLAGLLSNPTLPSTSDNVAASSPSYATSWLPAIGSLLPLRRRGGIFSAPDAPPGTLNELVSRLGSLEQTVAALSAAASDSRNAQRTSSKLRAELDARIAILERGADGTSSALQRVHDEAKAVRERDNKRFEQLEKVGKAIRDEVAELRVQLAAAQSARVGTDSGAEAVETARLDSRIDSLRNALAQTDKELERVGRMAAKADEIARAAADGLAALEKNLPTSMPVRREGRTGKLSIDPAFYQELRKVFMARDAVPSSTSSGAGAGSSVPTEKDWQAFRSANEGSLRALIGETVDFHAKSGEGAILSRTAFLDVLNAELDKAKRDLASRFDENLQGFGQELLQKARTQEEMYERAGSRSKSGKAGRSESRIGNANQRLADTAKAVPLITADGSDARASILALIDAALETYSADRLGMRDYALYSAGGRVVPSLTSPTLEIRPTSLWARTLGSLSGVGSIKGRSPVVALHHDSAHGMCWPFAGSKGQLGIALSRPVVVTDFTVEHVSREVAFDEADSAPREMLLWGVVERQGDLKKLKAYRKAKLDAETGRADNDNDSENPTGPLDILPAAPSAPAPNHLLLGSFIYDATPGSRSVQTFAISAELQALRIPVAVVVVQVASNWGNEEMTCVYRARVHGEEWTKEEEEREREREREAERQGRR